MGEVAAAFTPAATLARSLGASSVLVIATGGNGVGPLPDGCRDPRPGARAGDVDARWPASSPGDDRAPTDDGHRCGPRLRSDASEAQVIGTFLNTAEHLDGRPFLAHRRPEWLALEDKTVVDAVWDRAGVERAPAVVVPAEAARARSSRVTRRWRRWDGLVGGRPRRLQRRRRVRAMGSQLPTTRPPP